VSVASNSRSTAKNRHNNDPVDELKRRSRRRLVGAIALFFAAVIIVPALVETETPQTPEEVELVVPDRPSSEANPSPETNAVASAPQAGDSISTEGKSAEQSEKAVTPSVSAHRSQPDVSMEKPMELIYPPEHSDANKLEKQDKPQEPKKLEKPTPAKPEHKTEAKVEKPAEPKKQEKVDKPEKVEKPEAKQKKNEDVIASFADDEGPSITLYWVQVAAVGDKSRAEQLRNELSGQGFAAKVEAAGSLYRVRVGPFTTQNKAESAQSQLGAAGHQGRVVR
jgi:DedD protein